MGPHRDPHSDAVFRALADPTRRRVLELLRDGERPVADLVAACATTQPAMSQHLRTLREAGLAQYRQDGRRRLYRIEEAPLHEVMAWLMRYDGGSPRR
ncbi:MAG: winged helix-turn-helix transcriptional regulator [Acidothermales bacterium]|nr:winged helix-turn-helix transcriptional regulator [Acidothermales bacterium]